jgi:hypothetical protein
MSDVVAFPGTLDRIANKVREIDNGKTDAELAGVFQMTTEQLQKSVLDLWRGMAYSRQHVAMLQESIAMLSMNINFATANIIQAPDRALMQLRQAQQLIEAIQTAQKEKEA